MRRHHGLTRILFALVCASLLVACEIQVDMGGTLEDAGIPEESIDVIATPNAQDGALAVDGEDILEKYRKKTDSYYKTKKDPLGVPYRVENSLPAVPEWQSGWRPWATDFESHLKLILPQAWERPLTYQDLCAPYLHNNHDWAASRYNTLKELRDNLLKQPCKSNVVFQRNMQFLDAVVQSQNEQISVLIPNSSYEIDVDSDGQVEQVRYMRETAYHAQRHDGTTTEVYRDTISVDGSEVTWENSESTLYLLELYGQIVFVVSEEGVREGLLEQDDYGRCDRAYTCFEDELVFLGRLNGTVSFVSGPGRFVTMGDTDLYPKNSPLYRVCHEYMVEEGKLYHVRHGWQQANTLWLLDADMPFYLDEGKSISTEVMKKGTLALIIGYFQDDLLYIINDQGQQGIVQLTYDRFIGTDPVVSPGGERLTYYFYDYTSIAYAE